MVPHQVWGIATILTRLIQSLRDCYNTYKPYSESEGLLQYLQALFRVRNCYNTYQPHSQPEELLQYLPALLRVLGIATILTSLIQILKDGYSNTKLSLFTASGITTVVLYFVLRCYRNSQSEVWVIPLLLNKLITFLLESNKVSIESLFS